MSMSMYAVAFIVRAKITFLVERTYRVLFKIRNEKTRKREKSNDLKHVSFIFEFNVCTTPVRIQYTHFFTFIMFYV